MLEKHLLLSAAWAVYLALHSLTASTGFKSLLPIGSLRYYRLGYNVFATLSLLGVLVLMMFTPSWPLWEQSTGTRFLGLMLASFGVMLMRAALRQYDLGEFSGMAQLKGKMTTPPLRTTGLLAHLRHPIYAATLLLVWGFVIFAASSAALVSAACISLYLVVAIPLEEKKLEKHYGTAYQEYKKSVPCLIPRKINLF